VQVVSYTSVLQNSTIDATHPIQPDVDAVNVFLNKKMNITRPAFAKISVIPDPAILIAAKYHSSDAGKYRFFFFFFFFYIYISNAKPLSL